MKVWFIPLSGIDPTDEFAHEHIDHYVQPGTLTAGHPASSYGLPVIVGSDGTAYGPGDVYDGDYSGAGGTPRDHALEEAAARAGYDREPTWGETDDTY